MARWYCEKCLQRYRPQTVPDRKCLRCKGPLKVGTKGKVNSVLRQLKGPKPGQPWKGLRHKRKRKAGRSDRKTAYALYLKSNLWKTIRARVLERDGRQCKACLGDAQVVHHLSYAKAVMEGKRDGMLVSLCHPCHGRIEFDGVRKVKLREANERLADLIREFNKPGDAEKAKRDALAFLAQR